MVPSRALVLINPLIPRGRRSVLIGLLYSGLSCQEPGSQELNCHGPHSLMSSTWELSLTISLLQHLKPAAWLRFHLHSRLPSWVRFGYSWTRVLQPAFKPNPVLLSRLGAPSLSLCFLCQYVYVGSRAKRYRTSSQLHFQEYQVPFLFRQTRVQLPLS